MIRKLEQILLFRLKCLFGLLVMIGAFCFVSSSWAATSCRSPRPTSTVTCLACNLKYEAGNEPADGQRAVIYTVYNRALNRHGGVGSNVCAQIYAKNQFSWTRTDITSNPQLSDSEKSKYEQFAQQVIDEMERGEFKQASCARFYHTKQKNIGKMGNYPEWSAWPNKKYSAGNPEMLQIGQIGGHLFMRPKDQAQCIDKQEKGAISQITNEQGGPGVTSPAFNQPGFGNSISQGAPVSRAPAANSTGLNNAHLLLLPFLLWTIHEDQLDTLSQVPPAGAAP